MKKRYLVGALATVGVASMLMKERQKREEFIKEIAELKYQDELADDLNYYIDQAGSPDQTKHIDHDQLENSKMVAEGSQFGVQYYSDLKAREADIKETDS